MRMLSLMRISSPIRRLRTSMAISDLCGTFQCWAKSQQRMLTGQNKLHRAVFCHFLRRPWMGKNAGNPLLANSNTCNHIECRPEQKKKTITTKSKNNCAGVRDCFGVCIGGTDGGSNGFISVTLDRPLLQFSVTTIQSLHV